MFWGMLGYSTRLFLTGGLLVLLSAFGACQSKKGSAPVAKPRPQLEREAGEMTPDPKDDKLEEESDGFGDFEEFDLKSSETIVDTTARGVIDEPLHEFGTVPQGMKVEHVFRIENVGQAPLRLINANASCGCTVPSFSTVPIPPGQSGEIQVVFNTEGKIGEQRKTVLINTSGTPAVFEVMIVGTVTAR